MDALGYLGLDHVFTANMTGNTVLLGLAVGRGQVLAALRSVSALLGFVVGLAVGASVIEAQKPASDTKRAVSRAILVEGAVLAAFTVLWHLPVRETSPAMLQALILSSAGAMGIQSAIVRRLNLPGIATTYITGTLTSFVAGIVGRMGRAKKLTRSTGIASRASFGDHRVQLQAGVFFVYMMAAVMSGVLQTRVSSLVAFSPLVAIALAWVRVLRSNAGEEAAA